MHRGPRRPHHRHHSRRRHGRVVYRSRGRGILSVIIRAIFFSSIIKMLAQDSARAKTMTLKTRKIATIVGVIGLAIFGIGFASVIMSDTTTVSNLIIVLLTGGMFVAFLGFAVMNESRNVYDVQSLNQNNNGFDNGFDNGQSFNEGSIEITCRYCQSINSSTDSHCSACGANL